jgi:small subunit ribosomal protein S6
LRTYELALVADPRISDDDMAALTTETKQLITSRGGEIVREESWGRRKLAYPINKVTEGRYHFLYLQFEPAKAVLLPEVELRLKQNDKVLRFLTVRTDEDLKRAANRAKPGQVPKTGGYMDELQAGADTAAVPAVASAVDAVDEIDGAEEEV